AGIWRSLSRRARPSCVSARRSSAPAPDPPGATPSAPAGRGPGPIRDRACDVSQIPAVFATVPLARVPGGAIGGRSGTERGCIEPRRCLFHVVVRPGRCPVTAVNDVRAHAGVALTPARRRFALFALALGGFGIGSSEFVTMGLLPEIASGLLPEM